MRFPAFLAFGLALAMGASAGTGCRKEVPEPTPEPPPSAVVFDLAPVAEYYGLDPAFSPKDGTLAFTRNSEAGGALVVVGADGSDRPVWEGPDDAYLPVWSPDGTQVAFLTAAVVGDGYVDCAVRVYDLASAQAREVAASSYLSLYDYQDPLLIWLPDSQGLVIWGNPVTFWERAGGTIRELSEPGAKTQFVSVSPDGRTVAYEEYVDGNAVIKACDIASGEARVVYSWGPLPAIGAFSRAPRWVSDEAILFDVLREDMSVSIWLAQLGGESREVLASACGPVLSPDRARFVFSHHKAGGGGVYKLESGLTTALPEGVDGFAVRWSPDGTRLLSWSLWKASIYRPATGDSLSIARAQLMAGSSLGWHPDWSPDGRRLALEVAQQGQAKIVVFELPPDD